MNLVVIKPLYVFFAKVLHKTPCLISLSKDYALKKQNKDAHNNCIALLFSNVHKITTIFSPPGSLYFFLSNSVTVSTNLYVYKQQ